MRYYNGNTLQHEVAVLRDGTAPFYIETVNGQTYYYPEIPNVLSNLNIQIEENITNFNLRQIYLVDYTLTLSGTSLTITPLSVDALPGRWGIVLDATSDVAPSFKAKSKNRQYGRCNHNATMPTILTSGTNRTYYTTYYNDTQVDMAYVADEDYYIEIDMTGYVTILNFITE